MGVLLKAAVMNTRENPDFMSGIAVHFPHDTKCSPYGRKGHTEPDLLYSLEREAAAQFRSRCNDEDIMLDFNGAIRHIWATLSQEGSSTHPRKKAGADLQGLVEATRPWQHRSCVSFFEQAMHCASGLSAHLNAMPRAITLRENATGRMQHNTRFKEICEILGDGDTHVV